MNYREKYDCWLKSKIIDEDTRKELINIKDENDIEDRFYKDLKFGTGGLRGIIGAGCNRMNIYTVGKATEGLAKYLKNKYERDISVSIAYDSRNKSKDFARAAAEVLAENGIEVNLFEDLRPTPMLSFTVGYLKSKAGIVITASHNSKEYNGYKVYGEDGGQITDKAASDIISEINNVNDFNEIKFMDFNEAKNKGIINIIGEDIDKEYIKNVKELSIRKNLVKEKAKDLKVIYTPIHGSGNKPVRRVLGELGYENVYVVKKQENPNGDFPTVSYPNPENSEVFNIALEMAEKIHPDLIFGTDPDCDRIGVVVKDKKGEYKVLTGNQMGVLLTEYMLSSLKAEGKLPKNGVIIKTIVTSDMVKPIAKEYGVEVIEVLTGFKYIGEKIKEFKENKSKSFILGFEESYGYLSGDFVRDKDAVIASMLICEMALYYKSKGMDLYEALMNLYDKYGFYKEELVSMTLKGKEGQEKINNIMEQLRHSMKDLVNGVHIIKKYDYKRKIEKDLININENPIDLPKSNVLKFVLQDDSWFVIRPSGTEPKIKVYFSVKENSSESSKDKMKKLRDFVMNLIS